MDQLRKVVDVARHGVAAVGRPLAVPVAPEIRRDDVPVVPEGLRRPVPVPAMIASAVHEEEGWLVGVAPVDVVQAQALRVVAVRGGSRHTRRQYHGLRGAGLLALPARAGMGKWHAREVPARSRQAGPPARACGSSRRGLAGIREVDQPIAARSAWPRPPPPPRSRYPLREVAILDSVK